MHTVVTPHECTPFKSTERTHSYLEIHMTSHFVSLQNVLIAIGKVT